MPDQNDALDDSARRGGFKPSAIDLTDDVRADLLDPETWNSILGLYANTMKLAVALIDADGRLVGKCHNPQPIWSLARQAQPEPAGDCLFCLETRRHCSAVASAIRKRSQTLAHDQAGFAHVALPLVLGNQVVGTLLAGQVLDRYPEPLPLERVARDFNISPQQIWDLARHIAPIGQAKLAVYGELLGALGQTVLHDRYGAIVEKRFTESTKTLNRELASSNVMLETKVAELDRSNSDLENLLDSTEIATIFLDSGMHIKRYTPASGTLIQLNPSDIGRHVTALEKKFAEAGLSDLIADVHGMFPLKDGGSRTNMREREVPGKAGKHYLKRILPYYTSQHLIDGLVITFIDVTDLKNAERRAQEAKVYAEHIVDTVREPLLVLDKDFRVVSANHSFYATFLISVGETVGWLLHEIGNGQWNIPELRRSLNDVLSLQTHLQDFEVEHEFPELGLKTMLLNARRVGTESLILLAIEDITERKHAENQLRKLNLDLEMFSQAAAHDLQEPLRTIKLSTQLLARDSKVDSDSNAHEYIAHVLEAADRLEALLHDLRQYWLANKTGEPAALVNSVQVLEKTLNDLAVPIQQSGARVTYDPLPTLKAEEVSLGMLFQNLVGNALKYRSPGKAPAIHISADKKGNAWCFSVKDDGIGIEPKNLNLIFAPFKRIHGKLYPGSGIGLALCEKIVERYGGRIWVESVYGQGSTFYFTIPVRVEAADATSA